MSEWLKIEVEERKLTGRVRGEQIVPLQILLPGQLGSIVHGTYARLRPR